MNDSIDKRPIDWPASERLRVLHETASLNDDDLGAYLRRVGLHSETVDGWRADALAGLAGLVKAPSRRPKVSRRERDLERELRRKEKALAEALALMMLEKKVRRLFEEPEADASSDP